MPANITVSHWHEGVHRVDIYHETNRWNGHLGLQPQVRLETRCAWSGKGYDAGLEGGHEIVSL